MSQFNSNFESFYDLAIFLKNKGYHSIIDIPINPNDSCTMEMTLEEGLSTRIVLLNKNIANINFSTPLMSSYPHTIDFSVNINNSDFALYDSRGSVSNIPLDLKTKIDKLITDIIFFFKPNGVKYILGE